MSSISAVVLDAVTRVQAGEILVTPRTHRRDLHGRRRGHAHGYGTVPTPHTMSRASLPDQALGAQVAISRASDPPHPADAEVVPVNRAEPRR